MRGDVLTSIGGDAPACAGAGGGMDAVLAQLGTARYPLALEFARDATLAERFAVEADDGAEAFEIEFAGPPLGLGLREIGGFVVVDAVVDGGPAATGGAQRGDLLIAANGDALGGDDDAGATVLDAALAKLGGGAGWPLRLTLERSESFRARFIEDLDAIAEAQASSRARFRQSLS